MSGAAFPTENQSLEVRNKLICRLIELNLSHSQVRRLDLCCVRNGAGLSIQGEQGCSFITLTGESKSLLNAWQMLRPRSNPKSDALFITLRGKCAGQRISIPAIRHVARKSGCKPLSVRFEDYAELANDKHADLIQNQPALRVIQGGRR